MAGAVTIQQPLPLLVSSGTVGAGLTLQLNQANVLGYSRIVGNIFSSVAPAAGFPRLRFSADGVTFDYTVNISQDIAKANFNYTVDVPILAPYCTVEVQDAGAGSTVRAAVYAMPFAAPGTVTASASPPAPATGATYVSVFDGLSAPNGQFFELIGAANLVVRVKDIYFFKPSVSVGFKALAQSVASTGGTSSGTAVTKHDQNDPAAGASIKQYTVAPTPGSSVGNLISAKSITAGDALGWSYGDNWDQPVVVRNGQSLALSVDAAATVYGYVRWSESAS